MIWQCYRPDYQETLFDFMTNVEVFGFFLGIDYKHLTKIIQKCKRIMNVFKNCGFPLQKKYI